MSKPVASQQADLGPLAQRLQSAEALAATDSTAAAAELLDLIISGGGDEDNANALEDDGDIQATNAAVVADVSMGGSDTAATAAAVVIEDELKIREAAVYALGELYVKKGMGEALHSMFENIRPFFNDIPKARTAKIVRSLIDMLAKIPDAASHQERLCLDTVEWCRTEKRTFLRHRVETRLALLYQQMQRHSSAMEVITRLTKEVKKLDDKLLLVEIHLIEAQIYFSTRNIPKAKAALTASRSNSNAIHCPPMLQADIDSMAGALHCEEGDPKTAFSYFYEAFQAFNIADDPRATQALKYMMLTKVMCNQSQEVIVMSSGKYAVKHAGRGIDALKAVATSCQNRDLEGFEKALTDYSSELRDDPLIQRHTDALYQNLLEQNISKVLEAYSRVEVAHVAKLMRLPQEKVQTKLSEMILDKKLAGVLDQGAGLLILFENLSVPSVYENAVDIFKHLGSAVDLLQVKARKAV